MGPTIIIIIIVGDPCEGLGPWAADFCLCLKMQANSISFNFHFALIYILFLSQKYSHEPDSL